MPDLDLIKQGGTGGGTAAGCSPGAGRVIPPAGRVAAATTSTAPPGCCSRRGRGADPQGRRDGARGRPDRDAALHGTRAAAVPRAYREIHSAADRGRQHGGELRAVGPGRFSGDGRGHFRTARGEITPGEAETIAGVVDTLRAGDRNNQEGWLSSQSAADFDGGR